MQLKKIRNNDERVNMRRREFLKTAANTAVGIAFSGGLAGCNLKKNI